MIEREKIVRLTEETLADDQFVVEVSVSQANLIVVTLDGEKGIAIDDCVRVSRHIEGNLDREAEDFELQVSSAGLGQPLRVFRQYVKNIGREVEVVLTNGEKLKGVLKDADPQVFVLEVTKTEKVEGQKKKQPVNRLFRIAYEEVKTVKNMIKF